MVAAANPLAVAAGLRVLKAGGSAVDAAVAVQAVLGLVEPQSSGLGGGAFLTYYDAKSHRVTAYDGREVAPAGASPRQFLGADGRPLPPFAAMQGGIASGVPGAIAMLEMAQKDHGRLPWRGLFGDARALALKGFVVSPRLASAIRSGAPGAATADAHRYFSRADGTPLQAGDRLANPAYAASLDAIAQKGAAGLLQGPLAAGIIASLQAAPLPSTMTLADLAAYRPRRAEALCRPYRVYAICTPGAPSGGPAVQEALGLLAHTDIAARRPDDEKAWFLFAQASRLAYADRDRYEGDPTFVRFPQAGLLAPAYLADRAKLIGEVAGPVSWGQPQGAPTPGADHTQEPGGTTHFVIVDARGNAVSMTTTVENVFGNGRMVGGFFLNNQLTDFSFSPSDADGTPAANAVAPGKRPRSSMAPTIVLGAGGRLVAATGSPGGSSIIAYTLKSLVALLDWHMRPQEAAALPNLVARGGSFTADPFPQPIMAGLAARALPLQTARGEASGIHSILVVNGRYVGGADPRREGQARGF
ncbi:MAG TPA: gamma-glutamyltransferase family protein [Novosphingobium sp.]|nr:gamma-glutamyltransferase family protein [Novosphingobium sp.]